MQSIGTREVISAGITLLLLPVVLFVIGVGLFWLLVMIPLLFLLAVLLLKVHIWMVRKRLDHRTIEGHAVVIEERSVERDEDENKRGS